jgi:hypothetical protein
MHYSKKNYVLGEQLFAFRNRFVNINKKSKQIFVKIIDLNILLFTKSKRFKR